MIDDLKPMIGAYGYSDVVTPNIDRLAEKGMVFLNAHCQQALCGPSRVSMLTGMYPDSIGIYGMGNNKYKDAGYASKYSHVTTTFQKSWL